MTPFGIILCVILVLAVVALVYLYMREKSGKSAENTEEKTEPTDVAGTPAENPVSEENLESETQNVILTEKTDNLAAETQCCTASEFAASEVHPKEQAETRAEMPGDFGEVLCSTEPIEQDPSASRTTEEYVQWVKEQSSENCTEESDNQ